jgi:peptide/nickel transport system substrate-binding protein
MMRRSRLVTVVLLALALLGASAAQAGKNDDTLRIGWDRELENLDVYYNNSREAIIVSYHIGDSLLDRNPETNQYVPALATAWKWIDPLILELEIRKGVVAHNGETVDAEDVVYTLNFVSDPANGIKLQRNVEWIKRAEKVDQHRVRIHLKKPAPAALEYLSGPVVIYPREYHKTVGLKGMAVKPVATGPYRVAAVSPGREVTLERHDRYYEGSPKGKPAIKRIVIRTIPEANTQLAELMTGGIDWIWKVPPDQVDKLGKLRGISVVNGETMRIGFLGFDATGRTGKTPFTDLRVRRAIGHAVNRQAMVDNLLKGASKVIHSACFPTQFGCTDDVMKYEYDPAKAKRLLAEAGFAAGFETELYAYQDRNFAEAILGDLARVGIRANLRFLQLAAYNEKRDASGTPMLFGTWGSYSINDSSAGPSRWFKHDKADYALDPEVKQWLETADTSVDPAVRKDHYAKALKRIAEQAYWVPLFSYNLNYAFSSGLDFKPDPDEVTRFYRARWK